MFFIQKKRSVTPIGHSQYLTGKVATCSGLPHLPEPFAFPLASFAFLERVALVAVDAVPIDPKLVVAISFVPSDRFPEPFAFRRASLSFPEPVVPT